MPDIAPFLFERAENAPTVPAEGRFLLPLCVTEEELHILLGAAFFYAEASGEREIRHLIPLMQAAEYIGQVQYAECMGFFEEQNEGDCVNYKPYAPFLIYKPSNPFNEPDLVPAGYLEPPWKRGDTLEFPAYLGFLASDVMINSGSLAIWSDWGDVLGLNFPTIELTVKGHGQIEIDFIGVLLGGFAIVKVGSPPNIFDIVDGIIDTGATIVDLNQDSISIPPESDFIVAEEIPVDSEEFTTVYIVFVPKVDDSLGFFGMGGGIRQIGLCGLETEGEMAGIEDIRWAYGGDEGDSFRPPLLQKRVAGVWSTIENGDDVGGMMLESFRTALDAWAMAYAIRNLEPFDSWRDETFQGWNPSPLKTYIDAAGESFDPSDLEAAIAAAAAAAAAAQSDADAAASAASAAQATASGAVAVNAAQATSITAIQAVNTTQNTNITNLQGRMTTAENNIIVLTGDVVNHYGRLEALDFGGAWAWYHDLTSGAYYSSVGGIGVWVSGFGWNSVSQNLNMDYTPNPIYQNQITHMEITLLSNNMSEPEIEWTLDGVTWTGIKWTGAGNLLKGWLRVPNAVGDNWTLNVRVRINTGSFTVRGLRYIGRGALPF